MKLAQFILNLFEYGDVTVEDKVEAFSAKDLQDTVRGLEFFYKKDILNIPNTAPTFHSEAALWGAQYIYRAVQMIVLRELGEEEVKKHLTNCPFEKTPEVIYSIDLTMRYLGDLLNIAKGLAPDDILVTTLKQSALEFPFSSVGLKIKGELDEKIILSHPALKYAYADRIINKKDKSRIQNNNIQELVKELLGNHTSTFWSEVEFDDTKDENNDLPK